MNKMMTLAGRRLMVSALIRQAVNVKPLAMEQNCIHNIKRLQEQQFSHVIHQLHMSKYIMRIQC